MLIKAFRRMSDSLYILLVPFLTFRLFSPRLTSGIPQVFQRFGPTSNSYK